MRVGKLRGKAFNSPRILARTHFDCEFQKHFFQLIFKWVWPIVFKATVEVQSVAILLPPTVVRLNL